MLFSALDRSSSGRGQSLLETALFLPVLLLFIAGLLEVGAYAIDYMTMLDASREGGRYGANLDPELTSKYPFDMHGAPFPDVRAMTPEQLRDVCDNGETTNFYYEVACLAFQNIPTGNLDPDIGDDIVITVIGVANGSIVHRWPLTPTHRNPDDQGYHFQGANDNTMNSTCTISETANCRSWSLYGNRDSLLDNEFVNAQLESAAPNTAFVAVEVFHAHPHFTGLFTIGDYIPNPIESRAFSIFPVSAAEP